MPEDPPAHTGRGPLLVVLAAVCWGTGGLAGSVLGDVSGLSPLAVATYRLLVAAVVLFGLHALRGELGRVARAVGALARRRADAARVLGVGAGLALFQVCYFLAVQAVGVAVATMLTLGLAPVLVTLGGALLLGERVGTRLTVVLPVALVGLVLLVGGGAGGGVVGGVGGVEGVGVGVGVGGDGRTLLGAAFATVSAIGYAAVTLLGRSLSGRVASEHVTSLGFVVAALVALPGGLVVGMTAPLRAETIGLVLYLGVVPTAVAYGLFFTGLRGTRSGSASVLTLVEPLTATVLSVALIGERLAAWQWVGAGLLAASVVVLSLGGGRAPRLGSGHGTPRTHHRPDELGASR